MTYAPRDFAIWTARWPTPPAAACTSTRCPGSTPPMSTRHCHAVSPANGSPAASHSSSPAGRRAKCRDGAVTNSAYAAACRGNQGMPYTGSPTANRVTPGPTASTMPATSQPTVNGGRPKTGAIPPPERVFQSTGFTPAAITRTRTSVGSGSGTGSSSSPSTSGPPTSCWTIARIAGVYHVLSSAGCRGSGDRPPGRGRPPLPLAAARSAGSRRARPRRAY